MSPDLSEMDALDAMARRHEGLAHGYKMGGDYVLAQHQTIVAQSLRHSMALLRALVAAKAAGK